MRKIKFRGWCKSRKEMLNIQRISFKNNKVLPYGWNINWDSEEFEIMQYTGLKDKNGKEIYEGEIVKWGHLEESEENPIRVAIVEINPDIQFKTKDNSIFRYGNFIYKDTEKALEVIGNIFELESL